MMLTVASISCAGKVATYNGNGEVYVVLPKDYDSKKDLKWSKYLYDHILDCKVLSIIITV